MLVYLNFLHFSSHSFNFDEKSLLNSSCFFSSISSFFGILLIDPNPSVYGFPLPKVLLLIVNEPVIGAIASPYSAFFNQPSHLHLHLHVNSTFTFTCKESKKGAAVVKDIPKASNPLTAVFTSLGRLVCFSITASDTLRTYLSVSRVPANSSVTVISLGSCVKTQPSPYRSSLEEKDRPRYSLINTGLFFTNPYKWTPPFSPIGSLDIQRPSCGL